MGEKPVPVPLQPTQKSNKTQSSAVRALRLTAPATSQPSVLEIHPHNIYKFIDFHDKR